MAIPDPPRAARGPSCSRCARLRERRGARAGALRRLLDRGVATTGVACSRQRCGQDQRAGTEHHGRPEDPVNRWAYGRSRTARECNADRRGLRRRCRFARSTGRPRPHPHARRLRRLVVGGDGRGGKRLDHRARSGREGAGRDHGPVRARTHRLTAGHDRRPAGDARRARAPRGDRARADRPHPRTAADRVARCTDRSACSARACRRSVPS